MIKNLNYIFKKTGTSFKSFLFLEVLHGFLIAAPTGFLLSIIWELFKTNPNQMFIWKQVVFMLAFFCVQLWVSRKTIVKTNTTIYNMTKKLRIQLGDHLQKLSLGFYKKRDPGDLASVVLQDVSNFENIFSHAVSDIINAIFGTLFLSVFLVYLDFKLALLMLSVIPIAFLLIGLAGKLANKSNKEYVASRNNTSSRFIEYIQGIRHLKAYSQTGERCKDLNKAFLKLKRDSIRMEIIPGPFVTTIFILFDIFFLLMLSAAITKIELNTLTIPTFIGFIIIGYRLYDPLKVLMVNFATLKYMNVSAERIISVLKSPLQDSGQNLIPTNYKIEFKNVHFSYIDREILKGINLSMNENETTALVGASGSGKTTIANLIARFWDNQSGEITIGGINVKDIATENLYELISEVFQEVYLFDDTIYNNIKIGNTKATEAQIMEVVEKAQISEFLPMLSQGIHTKVGEGGSQLSGGQKQRVSIARAMLKASPILLLDEATASLDPENEIYIQQAIQELVKGKTVIVIAHKLQTIKNADKIIVLEHGIVKEFGKHEVLLENKQLYKRFWDLQQATKGWQLTSVS